MIRALNIIKAEQMSASELDRIDLLLLAELQRAGRQTNAELADRVHLSPSACLRRVRQLEANGVIRGYTAILDDRRTGRGTVVIVQITLEPQTDDCLGRFEQAARKHAEIRECYLMTGSQDYLLRVVTDGIEGYERFLKQKATRLKCIQSVESNFALATIKKRSGLPPV